MSLFFLPNETVLFICHELDDTDLLVLCQVSRLLNDLALSAFFTRHRVSSENAILATSASLPGIRLALSLSNIQKLSCTFGDTTAMSDISALTHFVSHLPPIRDFGVKFDRPTAAGEQPEHEQELFERFLNLLFMLIPNYSSPLLILCDGFISVSRRRHMYPLLEDKFPALNIRINNVCVLVLAIGLALLSQKALDLCTIVCDPLTLRHQPDRIKEDLHMHSCPTSIHIVHRFLTSRRFSKWILLILDQHSLTHLHIPAISALRSQWPCFLSNLTLPSLTELTISNNVRLPFPSLLSFLACHPSIEFLTLEYHSVTYTDLSPLPPNSLTHLRRLIATPRHILNILRESSSAAGTGQWRDMRLVGFAPASPYVFTKFGVRRPDPAARSESPFNFDEFDEALGVVADLVAKLSHSDFELHIQIPGGATSKGWFMAVNRDHNRRMERRMHHVSWVSFRTEGDMPLDQESLALLPRWLDLFPSVELMSIGKYVAPTQEARERLVREVHHRVTFASTPL